MVAYITVNSSKGEAAISSFTRNMQSSASTAASKFQSVGQSISGVGDNIYGVGGQLTKGITAPVGIAVGAVGGLTAALGWGRLKSVDTAQAQLKGLGYNTEDVNRITGQLTTALEGGMLTMGEATSAAASGMASGVSEGKELTRYIKVLDGAVAGSNGTFDEMNQIFARVQGNGKLMTGELQMVEQRMPGFTATMAKSFGVTQEEMQKMVSNGEVSADDFMNVMEGFAGNMATEYAKSWEGMVQNTKAYIGIIGEQLLGGVFEQSKESIAEFIEWMKSDEVQTWAAETGRAIGDAFSKILGAVKAVIDWWMNLDGTTQKVILTMAGIVVAIGPVLMIIGKIISVVGTLVSVFGTIIGVVVKVINIVRIVMGVMKALWLVMLANPIVLIIAAIVAIVAALVWFFTQTETGKAIWQGFMDWLGAAWEWIKTTALTVFTAIGTAILTAWNWIKTTTVNIWNGIINWIKDNWMLIIGFITGPVGIAIALVIKNWDKIKAVTATVWNWILNKIKAIWTGLVTAISNGINKARTWVTNGWNKIKSTTSTIWNAVKLVIARAFIAVVSTVQNKVNQVRNKISNAWSNVRSTTSNAFNGVKNAVSNGINGAVNFVRQLPGRALSALGNIGSKLYNSGWSMIEGFKNGIVNAFNNAVNAVRNGLNRIRNFFPFSPAKEGPFSGKGWTFYSGQSISEGLADGMAAGQSDVVRQAEAITKAAAFDIPTIPGMSGLNMHGSRSQSEQASAGVTNNFTVINPVAEPTSETARKASAYIGVSV